MRSLRTVLLTIAALSFVAVVVGLYQSGPAQAKDPSSRQVERGRTVAQLGGCDHCHTPVRLDPALGLPVPDRARELSGHPEGAPEPATSLHGKDLAVIGPTFTSFKVPLGTVFASNLTPDRETGLGAWNEALFVRTMRTGRHLGAGRPVLPPMPWRSIGDASDADLEALFAYLQSLPPIRNAVPPPKVSTEALDKLGRTYDALVQRDPPGH
jgi:hypothetical protein